MGTSCPGERQRSPSPNVARRDGVELRDPKRK
jgi:hypothetical protein